MTKALLYTGVLMLGVLGLAWVGHAEPYVALRGGTQVWNDQSNSDPLESGSEPGWAAGLAIGDEAGLSDLGLPKSDFALDIEVEALHRRESLHGRNHGPQHDTADGRYLDLTTMGANLWPGWQATRWLTLYGGGGGGAAFAQALGNTNWAPFWQVGGGLRVNATPALSFELGERSIWIEDVRLRGYRASYDAVHGAIAGVRWEFKR